MTRKYEITAPDGRHFEITAPEGASEAEVLSYARSQFEPQQSGSTFGGMLGEAGKGVVRGISDVGLMTGRGAGTVLLGPIAGGLMGRGIEALAAPSREPFTPSPEGPAEKYAGTAGEFAGAFAAPGAPGLALRGVQGASRIMGPVVAPVARTMRNLIDPLLPGGTERAVGRTLLKLAGERRAKVMSALAESQAEPLPGFVRLYRGERRPHPTLPETSYSDIGRWFTTDIGAARFYGNVKYVDVPEAVATAAKSEALVGPTIYTKTGRFLPVEWANKAKSFETSELVPGSLPTAAEAATKAGSAEFAGAQRLAEQRLPSAYQEIGAAQEGARQTAIQSFGRTPQQLEAAFASRAAEAKGLYEEASKQILRVDDELKTLLKTDSMKKAMERVKSIETEVGKARPSPEGTMSVGRLHYLKMAMDDFVKDPDKFGIAGLETAAYQGTRKQLVNWITSRSPLYDKARQTFAEASKSINVMQVGQQLEKSLTAPLAAAERPGPFATAMREAPSTLKKATGTPRFKNLEQAVGAENAVAAERVLADLGRTAQFEKLSRAGASRAGEIVGEAVPGLPATGPLHQKYMIFKTVFNRFGGKLGEKELEVLAEVLKTPQETLRVMRGAAAREAFNQSFKRSALEKLSARERLIAGSAAAAAEAQE